MSAAVDKYLELWARQQVLVAKLRDATEDTRRARNAFTKADEAELHRRWEAAKAADKARQEAERVTDHTVFSAGPEARPL